MTNDMIPVPRELLKSLAWAARDFNLKSGDASAHADRLLAASQPAPRLRVVNLDDLNDINTGAVRFEDWYQPSALPDPMTVIEQAVRDWRDHHAAGTTRFNIPEMLACIRAALIGAAK